MSKDHTKIPLELDPLQQRMHGVTRHGMVPFDCPFISQIKGNLWMGGCAGGMILPTEFEHLVSLYPWEKYQAPSLKSQLYVEAYDAEVEELVPTLEPLVTWIRSRTKIGPTLVHCQAGLNRSGLLVGLTLIREGLNARDAIALMREKRSPAVLCNKSFENHLLTMGDPS